LASFGSGYERSESYPLRSPQAKNGIYTLFGPSNHPLLQSAMLEEMTSIDKIEEQVNQNLKKKNESVKLQLTCDCLQESIKNNENF
jgi:hypothetical protein